MTGTGTWSAEGCCGGTLKIAGIISGDSLYLNVMPITTVPTSGPQASDPIPVDAVLTTRTDRGASSSFHLVKQTGGPSKYFGLRAILADAGTQLAATITSFPRRCS